MNAILASTSTIFGGNYLEYLREELIKLYENIDEILFIPYARPSGISHEEYTLIAKKFFTSIDKNIKGIHEYNSPKEAINTAEAYFVGGGNTFLLVKTLHDFNLMDLLKKNIESGKPYLGCSAGSNIGGINMQTTNDMPIVYPPSFDTMGLIPFNINPHYIDPNPNLKHNGETRETRIKEFLTQNNIAVVGLREGNWIRVIDNQIKVEGKYKTRIFEPNKTPYEVESGTFLNF